jgi:hypothetical protein
MLNLLFISDSPKIEFIKSALQPFLKVIIDVVTDFDHGLKDVFEKRPATVCIQDQIGGVTGESVARHIQMLLGSSAPTFILLHSGNGKARAIKGLYEHLIDLSQPGDTLAEDIKITLKSLLGDQWEKIYIPPKQSPASIRSSVAVPEESRVDADKLVDDFLSDLETSGFSVADDVSLFTAAPDPISMTPSPLKSPVVPPHSEKISDVALPVTIKTASDELAELQPIEAKPAVSKSEKQIKKRAASPAETKQYAAPPAAATPPAAEFRISHNLPTDEEPLPEDLLLAFEENYRAESPLLRRFVIFAVVCIVCAAAGWYLFSQKPQLVTLLKQRVATLTTSKQPPAASPVVAPVQKAVQPPATQPVVVPSLPTFVPKDGHDSTYAAKNPGWERYVGKEAEFRLFAASGRIQAIQVLAVKNLSVSDSLVKSVLQEFVGSSEYTVTSRNIKSGVTVENGKILKTGEVLFYKKNGAVKAFVVSVN